MAVHNFLNMHNPDDLDNCGVIKDEEINEEDARMAEEESDIGINQKRDEIAKLMWNSYC